LGGGKVKRTEAMKAKRALRRETRRETAGHAPKTWRNETERPIELPKGRGKGKSVGKKRWPHEEARRRKSKVKKNQVEQFSRKKATTGKSR